MKAKLSSSERTRLTALIHAYQAAAHNAELSFSWDDPDEIGAAVKAANDAEEALFDALYQPLDVKPLRRHARGHVTAVACLAILACSVLVGVVGWFVQTLRDARDHRIAACAAVCAPAPVATVADDPFRCVCGFGHADDCGAAYRAPSSGDTRL